MPNLSFSASVGFWRSPSAFPCVQGTTCEHTIFHAQDTLDETSTRNFSSLGGTGADFTKSASGHVMVNFYFLSGGSYW
jgi:hypothetical protein